LAPRVIQIVRYNWGSDSEYAKRRRDVNDVDIYDGLL
jgi:hypothetical protein